MFHLQAKLLFVIILSSVAHGILEQYTFGERVDGDAPIYYKALITPITDEPTTHSVTIEWIGNNETFTQVLLEHNGFDSAHFRDTRIFVPPYLQIFNSTLTHYNTRSLIAIYTLYGFSGKTHIDLFSRIDQTSSKPIVNSVTIGEIDD